MRSFVQISRLKVHFSVLLVLGLSQLCSIAAAPSNKSEFSLFQDIVSSNIFNAKRSPSYVPSDQLDQRREPVGDFLALTGTFMDEKGPRAFFNGNRSEYQKVVKPEDKIADFKVAAVDYSSVTLKSETNETKVPVGMQLSRKEGGPWHLGPRTDLGEGWSPPVASSNDRERSDRRDFRRNDRYDRGRSSFGRRDNGSSSETSAFPGGAPTVDLLRTDPALSGAGATNGAAATSTDTRSSGRAETPEETLQRLARQREKE